MTEYSIEPLTPAQQDEGDSATTAFEFTVTRADGDLSQPIDVAYQVGGSIDGDDITSGFTGTVTILADEATAVITVDVVGDNLVELDETLTVTLIDPNTNLAGASASATIVNDDLTPEFSIDSVVSDVEGNSGLTTFTVTVTRDGETAGTNTVTWAVTPGVDNPVDGADFDFGQPQSGTLTFAPGDETQDITFEVKGDIEVEDDETFTVTLSGATGGAIINPDAASATVTIENDDTPLVLTIEATPAQQDEGDSGTTAFEFTVTRAGGDLTQALDVDYQIGGDIDGDDIASSNFPTGTVTFLANQSTAVITVDVVGDFLVELDETLLITLIDPTTNTPGVSASATIVNDDLAPEFSIDSVVIDSEGNTGTRLFTITVTRDGETGGTNSVTWTATPGANPVDGGDFALGQPVSGTLTFAPGDETQDITFEVTGDTVVELDETFTVTLSDATDGAIINEGRADAIKRVGGEGDELAFVQQASRFFY